MLQNHYCYEKGDGVIPHSCPCCTSCFLFVAGPRTGRCAFGGPFTGYYETEDYLTALRRNVSVAHRESPLPVKAEKE